jgi:hypothetical protein
MQSTLAISRDGFHSAIAFPRDEAALDAEHVIQRWCAQSVHNRAGRDYSKPHQSGVSVKGKSQKVLEGQTLRNCSFTLKIRRYLVPWGFDSPSRHQPFS